MKTQLSTLDKIKKALNIEVDLATVTVGDGQATLEAEVFEAGQPVFIVNEDERIPLPVGEYLLDDGMTLVVTEEGMIAEIKETMTEEAVEEEEVAMDDKPTEQPLPKSVIESVVKETKFSKEEMEAKDAKIAELEAKITELSKVEEVEEAKEEVELSVEAPKPITHNPESGSNTVKFQYAKNAPDTYLDRILRKMN